MKKPTRKQLEVMLFIDKHIEDHDNFPTLKEIGYQCGIYPNAVAGRLKLMLNKGLVARHGNKYKRTQAFKQIINELGEQR